MIENTSDRIDKIECLKFLKNSIENLLKKDIDFGVTNKLKRLWSFVYSSKEEKIIINIVKSYRNVPED